MMKSLYLIEVEMVDLAPAQIGFKRALLMVADHLAVTTTKAKRRKSKTTPFHRFPRSNMELKPHAYL